MVSVVNISATKPTVQYYGILNVPQLYLRYFGLGTTLTEPSEHTYKYKEQSKNVCFTYR